MAPLEAPLIEDLAQPRTGILHWHPVWIPLHFKAEIIVDEITRVNLATWGYIVAAEPIKLLGTPQYRMPTIIHDMFSPRSSFYNEMTDATYAFFRRECSANIERPDGSDVSGA